MLKGLQMPTKIHSTYDSDLLCQDLVTSELSIQKIAEKHQISISLCYKIASGETRPELKERISELIAAEKSAGMRLAQSKARWAVARLVKIAQQDDDRRSSLIAIEKLLQMGGMLDEAGAVEKQTLEIIFTGLGGKAVPKNRVTGIWSGEN